MSRPKVPGLISMTLPMAARRTCLIDGRPVRLTPLEQVMVETLLLRGPDRWSDCARLTEAMWPNPDTQPETAWDVVKVVATRLRIKGVPIQSQYGWGYRIGVENRGRPAIRVRVIRRTRYELNPPDWLLVRPRDGLVSVPLGAHTNQVPRVTLSRDDRPRAAA